jgi:hypothetical protein
MHSTMDLSMTLHTSRQTTYVVHLDHCGAIATGTVNVRTESDGSKTTYIAARFAVIEGVDIVPGGWVKFHGTLHDLDILFIQWAEMLGNGDTPEECFNMLAYGEDTHFFQEPHQSILTLSFDESAVNFMSYPDWKYVHGV